MRKVIVSEFVTLDGVIEDPGGAEKFQHGGWTWPYFNGEMGKYKQEELFSCDALLLGRVTYQGFAEAWPSRTDDYGFADRMNGMPKFVVSRTLTKADWNNSTVISENVASEISRLKEQPGQDILIAGSGTLIGALAQEHLVDEYRLLVFPVVLGSGKRLFAGPNGRSNLVLDSSRPFATGVVALHYRAS